MADNPQIPGVWSEGYYPDQLIAGPMQRVTANGTLLSGQNLPRGAVLGRQTVGSVTATAGANTGNGTASAATPLGNALPGNYVLTATAATNFSVIAPDGRRLKDLTTDVAYSDEISLTLTAGGTAFVAGDSFTVAVAAGSGKYALATAAATDGTQNPVALLVDFCDASLGDKNCGLYLTGEFNINAVTLGSGISAAAARDALRAFNIHLKSAVTAADPS